MANSSASSSASSGVGAWNDITIAPHRLEWYPDDTRRVEHGGSLLGEGTFGSVYRGEMDGDCVAIKVIKAPRGTPGQRPTAGRRAAEAQHAREIRRLMELRFRHVVQCYGVSRSSSSDELLIITECLNGGSLHASLERARAADAPLSDLSFLTVASHMAKGLLYIHNSYYIHGDMKPHNVLLNTAVIVDHDARVAHFPDHVEAKVADFGMSKRLKQENPASLLMSTAEFGNHPCGTYAYMAPESFQGVRDLSNERLKAVDVYALGVCLYEMLSGMSPWKYEGVASPMQLQQLVCWEKRRPTWNSRPIRPEYKDLVEMCWDHDGGRRPTAHELKRVFDGWLKEARRRDADAKTSAASNPGSSNGSASSDAIGLPPPSRANGRRNPRAAAPPMLPSEPTIIRKSPLDDFTRVESQRISQGDVDRRIDSAANRSAIAAAVQSAKNGRPSPSPPSSREDGESGRAESGSDVQRVSSHDLDDVYAGEGAQQNEEGYQGNSENSSSTSSRTSGGGRSSDDAGPDRPDVSEASLEKRRQYWERRGPSIKHDLPVQEQSLTYSIGMSCANPVDPSDASLPSGSENAVRGRDSTERGNLEYSAIADAYITRVETQQIQEPERPVLGLPMAGLPGEDIFNTGKQADAFVNVEWDSSMLGAVERQNISEKGGAASSTVKNAVSQDQKSAAVVGIVQQFEALNTDPDSSQSRHPMAQGLQLDGAGKGRRGGSDHNDVMKAMGMFSAGVGTSPVVPSDPGASRRRDGSSDDVFSTATQTQPAESVDANPAKASQPEGVAPPDPGRRSAANMSRPNGHVMPPSAGQTMNANSHGLPAPPTLVLPQQPAYPPPPRQQTSQGNSFPQHPRSSQSQLPIAPQYGAPHGGSNTFLGGPQQLTVGNVLQALQSRDGTAQVQRWWSEGHSAVIAAALCRQEEGRSGGAGRIGLVIDLLRKVTTSELGNSSPNNIAVAKDLCIALGNVSRGGSCSKPAAQAALPMTLTAMKAFTWNMSVYSAACYALANVLKVCNDIPDERVRRDVADWISHATSFNLNNSSGSEPTLAYLTAAAARNFVWRKVINATTFFARREAQNIVHASAAENLCKSMIFFQPDPTVVEACLSAFAALAFFPSHRINLISIGTIGAVTRVMERPTNGSHEALMTMGLATLGIIVARPANQRDTTQIVDALINEGGVRSVVKVLDDAVRVRQPRVMEEGLYALASIARFDSRLGQHIVQRGGVGPVIQAVFCSVNGAPDTLTTRAAEVMCDVVEVLSKYPAAAGAMRRTALSQPLATLIQRFESEQRVVNPGRQAIGRIA